MSVLAIRGAITIDKDTPEQIEEHTQRLLSVVMKRNNLLEDNIVSIFFTATPDIVSMAPAAAARAMGLDSIPFLCAQEMRLENSLPLCIRLLMHADVDIDKSDVSHVFLRDATVLRPDLALAGDEQK